MSELVLDSCVARYRRAEEHMQTIENEIGEWKKTAPYRFVSQANAERTRFSMLIRVRNPPALLRWSLILSDAVNGLRCSLDHLIHAIAIKQDALPPIARILTVSRSQYVVVTRSSSKPNIALPG